MTCCSVFPRTPPPLYHPAHRHHVKSSWKQVEGVEKADACEAFCNLLWGELDAAGAYNAQSVRSELPIIPLWRRSRGHPGLTSSRYRDRRIPLTSFNDAITAYGLE